MGRAETVVALAWGSEQFLGPVRTQGPPAPAAGLPGRDRAPESGGSGLPADHGAARRPIQRQAPREHRALAAQRACVALPPTRRDESHQYLVSECQPPVAPALD